MQYHYSDFTLQLNHLPDGLRTKLPPTDSRFRPDQRALENGDVEQAAQQKELLENRQRETRKHRELNPGNDFVASYFEKVVDPLTQEEAYVYGTKRDYWQDRSK